MNTQFNAYFPSSSLTFGDLQFSQFNVDGKETQQLKSPMKVSYCSAKAKLWKVGYVAHQKDVDSFEVHSIIRHTMNKKDEAQTLVHDSVALYGYEPGDKQERIVVAHIDENGNIPSLDLVG
jgi:hypothetical protein